MKTIHTTFFFEGSGKEPYQTLVYTDGSTTCNCPGWTKRVQSDGSRTCKHTRYIAAGMGEQVAIRVLRNINGKLPDTRQQVREVEVATPKSGRVLNLDL